MRAVILAGGKGTRLEPYTWLFPKPLVPLGDKPVMEILIRQLARYGITHITVAIGHLGELVATYFGDGSEYGVQIDYSREENALGTAGPLALIDGLEDDFFVMNGDILTTLPFDSMMRFHRAQGGCATVAMHHKDVKLQLGVIHTNGNHEITGYVEKPTLSYAVSMGIYIFTPHVLQHIPSGNYLDFPDLVQTLLQADRRVISFPCSDYWADIGTHADYETAVAEYEERKHELIPGRTPERERGEQHDVA